MNGSASVSPAAFSNPFPSGGFTRTRCGTYKNRKGECTAHYIRVVVLEKLVLENLCKIISYVHDYEDDFVQQVTHNMLSDQTERVTQAKRQLELQTRRIAEIDAIIKRLYEDNVIGKLSDERFAKMSVDFEQEQKTLENSAAELRKNVESCEKQNVNVKSFIKIVRRYIEPTGLTLEILHELVSKILVHAPDLSAGQRTQQIDIHYNFVGEIALSSEIAKREPT